MSMNFLAEYESKKCSPEQAISMIKSEDVVYTGGEPNALLEALYNARENFDGLLLCSMFGIMGPQGENINSTDMIGHINLSATVLPFNTPMVLTQENRDQVPAHFSEMEDIVVKRYKPTYLLTHVSPMDEYGYLYMGTQAGCGRAAVDCGAKVIVQVNENMPTIFTDYYKIHISEVTAICEATTPLDRPNARVVIPQEIDKTIAGFVAERIPNGATIQLGAGAVPNIVGTFLDNHKDLGIHSEVFLESMKGLMEKGAVNNSKKNLMPGVSVSGFLNGPQEVRDFAHKNPNMMFKKLAWVNDCNIISQIDNIMSVNSCFGVDLRGQVCSDSLGLGNTGGIGGQLDFVRGARKANGGKSFIVMRSSLESKSGEKISKITMSLPEGSVVSTPRHDVMYVVTEYGVADLHYKSVKESAEALIAIAHPDFREELTFEAKKYGYL